MSVKKFKKTVIKITAIFALGFASAKGLENFESAWGVTFFPGSVKASAGHVLQSSVNNKAQSPLPLFGKGATHVKIDEPEGNAVCFTPPSGCAALIVKTIAKAKRNIFVQAYGFSHPEIARALIEAKQRGVGVKVLLDRSNLSQGYSRMKELLNAGIEVKIDKVPGIAHNKVMILDEKIVITGSFNFTKNADKSNAENVLIVESSDIAQKYLTNWFVRSRKSEEQKN